MRTTFFNRQMNSSKLINLRRQLKMQQRYSAEQISLLLLLSNLLF